MENPWPSLKPFPCQFSEIIKAIIFVPLLVATLCAGANHQTDKGVVVTATDRGSVDATGTPWAKSFWSGAPIGDLQRFPPGPELRNWLLFPLPDYTARATGAVLHLPPLWLPTNFDLTLPWAPGTQRIEVHAVESALDTLRGTTGWPRPKVFADLGEGQLFGSGDVGSDQPFDPRPIALNRACLEKLWTTAGSEIAFGGSLAGLDRIPGNGDALFDPLLQGFAVPVPFGLELLFDRSTPPVILAHPASARIAIDATATLSVEIWQAGELVTYQWLKADVELPGATGPHLYVTGALRENAGLYSVRVTGAGGTVASRSAKVEIIERGLRWKKDPDSISLPFDEQVVLQATLEMSESCWVPSCPAPPVTFWLRDGAAPVPSSWETPGDARRTAYLSLGPAALGIQGRYQAVASNAWGMVTSAVARVTAEAIAPRIEWRAETRIVAAGTELNLSIPDVFQYLPGVSVTLLHNGLPLEPPDRLGLYVSRASHADAGRYEVLLKNSIGTTRGVLADVVVEPVTPRFAYWPLETVSILEGHRQQCTVFLEGASGLDTAFFWYRENTLIQATPPNELSYFMARSDHWFDGLLAESGRYSVVASNAEAMITSPSFQVVVERRAPVFVIEPEGGTVAAGDYLDLRAVAEAGPPATYQWFHNGTRIPGATNESLWLASASASDAGEYWVVGSNPLGKATSQRARVEIFTAAPRIITQPLSITVEANGPFSFQANADGAPPPTFQWYHDGIPIVGETYSGLIRYGTRAADAGDYWVVARNQYGRAESLHAQLRVTGAMPSLLTEPADHEVLPGVPVSFTALASGAPGLSFAWVRENDSSFSSAGNTLVFKAATQTIAGRYALVVSNDFGAVTSRWAALRLAASGPLEKWGPGLASPGQAELNALIVGTDRWIGVGDQGRVVIGLGHGSLTEATVGSTDSLVAGVYDGSRFRVLGGLGRLYSSADGERWEGVGMDIAGGPTGMAYGDGLLVATIADGRILTSLDGETWRAQISGVGVGGTNRNNPSITDLAAVAHGGGRFVAVGAFRSPRQGFALVSSDGTNWTTVLVPIVKRLRAVAFADGMFITAGNDGGLAGSTDGGASWRAIDSGIVGDGNNLRCVTHFPGTWVAAGDRGIVVYSDGMSAWHPTHADPTMEFHSLAAVGERLLGAGSDLRLSDPILPVLEISSTAREVTVQRSLGSHLNIERSEDLRTWVPWSRVPPSMTSVGKPIAPETWRAYFRLHSAPQ